MNLSANKFVVLSNFVCFTSCLIISSLIWSSLVLTSSTAQATGADKSNYELVLKDDINELSHSSTPGEIHQGMWRMTPHRISPSLLRKISAKYVKQNWLRSHKRQMEEQPPPGFVGARGRRAKQLVWEFTKGKRVPTVDYETLTEVFPDLLPQLGRGGEGDGYDPTVTEELMDVGLASGKKSDTIVYKDGFLGVRG